MKWTKRLLYTTAIISVLAIVLPFLIPLNFLVPRVEKVLSDKIHEPVAIQSMRLALLPAPGVVLEDVSVGKFQDAKSERITVAVDISSLFAPVKVVNSITIDSLGINQDSLGRMPGWFKPTPGPQQAMIKRVVLRKTTLSLKAVNLGELNADIELGQDGGFQHAVIEAENKSMKLSVTPAEGKNFALDFEAKQWKPPAGPAIQFDSLHAVAWVNAEMLKLKEIDGVLYGGTLHGNAQLGWHDGWRLNGKLQSKGAEIHKLASLFSPETSVSGKLNADARFAMRAKLAGKLFESIAADVDFKIKDGVLYNFDLAGAVKSLSGSGTRGGQTRFDDFNGQLQVAGKAYHFRQLKISSGLLAGEGNLDITPDKTLSGRMHVEMKGTANLISMPLQISGSLSSPVLRPTNAAIAGAVAGTATLGPGFGTSVGAKAGDFLDKMFGK